MDDPTSKTLPVTNREDPFVIEEVIGEGGMGKVYRAHDPTTGALLAVKVLGDVGDPTRFALESDILSKLHHPNIVAYRAHGLTQSGQPYLAMEWIDGDDLERTLETQNLTVAESLRVGHAIASALAAAHEAGVIHRDLKPSNVILTRADRAVKLVDFGIARAAAASGITKTGQALGTPGYMSPEQTRGFVVDARTDLFSLGCLLFRCVGGRRPFGGSDIMQFATSLALETPPLLRQIAPFVPPALESLVARLLQKDPTLRPESALAVVHAIDRIVAGEDDQNDATAPTQVAPTEIAPPPRPVIETQKSPRRPMSLDEMPILLLFAVFALPLTALVFWWLDPVRTFHKNKGMADAGLEAAAPSASAAAPDPSSLDHAGLARACRSWADAIAAAQRGDGGFAGEERSDPSGWDTAQQLFALTEAHRACEGGHVEQIAKGAHALKELHVDGGWIGPRKGTPSGTERIGETPAIAWAVLAFEGAVEIVHDPVAVTGLALAKRDLAKARNADGGYREHVANIGKSMSSVVYPTTLAAWGLDDGAAKTWLAASVDRSAPGTRAPGFSEELAFVLRRGPASTKQTLAAEIIAHCSPDALGACERKAYDTGRVPLEADAGQGGLVAPWHPWATLAAATYAKDADLDADTRKQLDGIARWGIAKLAAPTDELGAAPHYKLAEYLIAVSELLELK